MAASAQPKFRGAAVVGSAAAGTANIVLTIPATGVYPNDILLVTVTGHASSGITQTAGMSFGAVADPASFSQTGCLIGTFLRYAAASSNGKYSTDAGTTITFTNSLTTNTWMATLIVIRGGYVVQATALHKIVKSLNGPSVTTLVVTGGTPTLPNCLHLTIGALGTNTDNTSNSFATTAAISGGGTDANFTINSIAGSASARGRALAVYQNANAPTVGVVEPDRTLSLTGGQACAIDAISLTIAPMRGEAGDRVWDVPSMTTPSSATLNVMDVLYPNQGSPPPGGWPWVLNVHGGQASGDKNLGANSIAAALLTAPYGCAVVAINFRSTGSGQPTNTGHVTVIDIHGTIRYLRAVGCALYGLNPARVVAHGGSAGATAIAAAMVTPGVAVMRDAAQGNPTTSEEITAAAILFPESHFASVDSAFTQLGLTRTPQLPAESAGSNEEISLVSYNGLAYAGSWQGVKKEDRWDATAYPMNWPATQVTTQNRFNEQQTQWWLDTKRATYWKKPYVWLSHGDQDVQIPFFQSFNDQSGSHPGTPAGSGMTLPTGLYQKLVGAGVPVTWEYNVGAGHGDAYWNPPTDPTALNPALIGRLLTWIAGMATNGPPVLSQLITDGVGGGVFVNDRDLVDFGFHTENAPGAFGALDMDTPGMQIAGTAGQVLTSGDAVTAKRIITVHGYLEASSVAAFREQMARLINWCSVGTMELRTAHDSTVSHFVRFKGTTLPVFAPEFVNATAIGDLVFETVTPYAIERVPQPYAIVTATNLGRVMLTAGTGPTLLIGKHRGAATNPKLIMYDAYGRKLQETQFTVTLGASDFLGWDSLTKRISVSSAGSAASADSVLRAGDRLPVPHPMYGDYEAVLGTLMEITAGRALLQARRTWKL